MNPRTVKPAVLVISALVICAYFLDWQGSASEPDSPRRPGQPDRILESTFGGAGQGKRAVFFSAYRPMGALFHRPMFALIGFSRCRTASFVSCSSPEILAHVACHSVHHPVAGDRVPFHINRRLSSTARGSLLE